MYGLSVFAMYEHSPLIYRLDDNLPSFVVHTSRRGHIQDRRSIPMHLPNIRLHCKLSFKLSVSSRRDVVILRIRPVLWTSDLSSLVFHILS